MSEHEAAGAPLREPMVQIGHSDAHAILGHLVGFNEHKQEWFCRVCRYRPVTDADTRLHEPHCVVYRFHVAIERAEHDLPDDEPSVIGAGDGPSPMPLRSEAETVWRQAYVARMVERGIDLESAQACCDAGDADLSSDPADAADDELAVWAADDSTENKE